MKVVAESSVPRLARGVRTRFDPTRQKWIVLAPERLFVPDDIAYEIIRRCDGLATVGAIADDLAAAFDEQREVVLKDVTALLTDLEEKGVVVT